MAFGLISICTRFNKYAIAKINHRFGIIYDNQVVIKVRQDNLKEYKINWDWLMLKSRFCQLNCHFQGDMRWIWM